MRFSQRVRSLPPYLFAGIERQIAERRAAGVDVISLGIGDPDLPTPPHIVEALAAAAAVQQPGHLSSLSGTRFTPIAMTAAMGSASSGFLATVSGKAAARGDCSNQRG